MFVLLLLDFAVTSTEIFNLLGEGIFRFSLLLVFFGVCGRNFSWVAVGMRKGEVCLWLIKKFEGEISKK